MPLCFIYVFALRTLYHMQCRLARGLAATLAARARVLAVNALTLLTNLSYWLVYFALALAAFLAPTARVELYFFLAWSYHRSAKGFTNLLVWLTVNDTALLAPLAPKCCRSERARDAAAAAADDDAAAAVSARNVVVGGDGGGSARPLPVADATPRDSAFSMSSAAPPDADATVRPSRAAGSAAHPRVPGSSTLWYDVELQDCAIANPARNMRLKKVCVGSVSRELSFVRYNNYLLIEN